MSSLVQYPLSQPKQTLNHLRRLKPKHDEDDNHISIAGQRSVHLSSNQTNFKHLKRIFLSFNKIYGFPKKFRDISLNTVTELLRHFPQVAKF